MAIKYNVSYSKEWEKQLVLDKFKKEIEQGVKCKVIEGKPYNHIYINIKDK